MITLTYGLYVAAFVLFVLATFGVPSGRISLVAAGLACLTLTLLLTKH